MLLHLQYICFLVALMDLVAANSKGFRTSRRIVKLAPNPVGQDFDKSTEQHVLAGNRSHAGNQSFKGNHSSYAWNDRHKGNHSFTSNKNYQKGDLACMRWSGGTCSLSECKAERGTTKCINGLCMCPEGFCADAWGRCVSTPGKWIGSYSIKFKNSYDTEEPFLGARKSSISRRWDCDWDCPKFLLSSTDHSSPSWKMALTAAGFVRLESIKYPGNVLTIYHNRRRRTDDDDFGRRRFFLVQKNQRRLNSSGKQMAHKAKISDDDDLWPSLKSFTATTPIDATFQVREVPGGHEIWDPQRGVSIASANPDWYIADSAADSGVAECYPAGVFGDTCDDRQVLMFKPELPPDAISNKDKLYVYPIANLHTWQGGLIIALFFLPFALCFMCMKQATPPPSR
eukprot:gnl/MRDRNA2_/MRDRNA2_124665_c0_seq1.p1 gnl/MRDRNA2_/MRDRNA2_124665_c0~~gnl/MRDRNA2_/MRDRNA2_124665_c0_seq1.p1  ORF type:complete len:398 (-),score=49.70 gnl/MRDRNA2_/MRDRNA2_124665_c0_seq1:86-1279(-)